MALINTAIKPFKATAFKDGEFVDVSSEDIKGKWAVSYFTQLTSLFVQLSLATSLTSTKTSVVA